MVGNAGGALSGAAAGLAVGWAGAADGQSVGVREGAGGAGGGVGQALVGAVVDVRVGGHAVEAHGGVQAGRARADAEVAELGYIIEELSFGTISF